jgi:hypothetical protein
LVGYNCDPVYVFRVGASTFTKDGRWSDQMPRDGVCGKRLRRVFSLNDVLKL